MQIKQITLQNPENNNHQRYTHPKRTLLNEDAVKSVKIIERKRPEFSHATTQTRSTRQQSQQLSSLKEEAASLTETANAKAKIPLLHGRNYGRSLTLEMEDDPMPFLSNKWTIIAFIIFIGLGVLGVIMLNGEEQNVRPKMPKGKGRKNNK